MPMSVVNVDPKGNMSWEDGEPFLPAAFIHAFEAVKVIRVKARKMPVNFVVGAETGKAGDYLLQFPDGALHPCAAASFVTDYQEVLE